MRSHMLWFLSELRMEMRLTRTDKPPLPWSDIQLIRHEIQKRKHHHIMSYAWLIYKSSNVYKGDEREEFRLCLKEAWHRYDYAMQLNEYYFANIKKKGR